MQLRDFDTLALAKAYSYIQYSIISSSKGAQYFSLMGVLDNIESNQNNATVVQVFPTLPQTTVGMLCKAIIKTIDKSNDGFVVAPTLLAGQLNRAAAQLLVDNAMFSQAVYDGFFAQAETVITPFENSTKHDFELAKGIIQRTPVTVEQGYCTIATAAGCERHNPQIYQRISLASGDIYKRVAGFSGVDVADVYSVQCPNLPDLFVDDAYNVVG